MPESVQVFDELYISSSENSGYTGLEFLPGSMIGAQQQLLDPQGLRGHRGTISARVRETSRQVIGNLQFAPGPTDLDILLEWITGSAKSANNFIPAANVPARFIRVKRDSVWHMYKGVRVATATFQASEGSPLMVTLSIVGTDEVSSANPNGAAASTLAPYILGDAVLTVGSTDYQFRSVAVQYDNVLDVRYNNSVTPSSITAADLAVAVSLTLPYGDASALYGLGTTASSVTVTFSNGNYSFAMSMPAVQAPREPIPLGNRGQVRDLSWNGIARKSGSNEIITFTNDSTP